MSSEPVAYVSAKLQDVYPDGTSSLVSRTLLNLCHRDGFGSPTPMPVGEPVDVVVTNALAGDGIAPLIDYTGQYDPARKGLPFDHARPLLGLHRRNSAQAQAKPECGASKSGQI